MGFSDVVRYQVIETVITEQLKETSLRECTLHLLDEVDEVLVFLAHGPAVDELTLWQHQSHQEVRELDWTQVVGGLFIMISSFWQLSSAEHVANVLYDFLLALLTII